MDTDSPEKKKTGGCLRIALLVIGVAVMTSVLTLWVAKVYLFPREFKPVQLSAREEKVLNTKIDAFSTHAASQKRTAGRQDGKLPPETAERDPLTPEPYSEKDADRTIRLSERELNALLAKNTDLARRLAIDLSDDLASAKLLVPLDPELPFFGGKTLRVTAGMELRYREQRPVAILRGVSIWGVPLPNEWLGGIKNIDLARESGMDHGFWRAISAGIEQIRIEDGSLTVKLKP